MKKLKMAIVGYGFVGKAVAYGFNDHSVEKTIVDPKEGVTIDDIKWNHDVTFVCVPTPMADDGSIDATILHDVMKKLKNSSSGMIVLKSTVTPDIVKKITEDEVMGHRIVYNPEFLTERQANEDFINPIMHVFGGHPDATRELESIYEEHSLCRPCEVHHMSAVDASFVKYGINCFLATKVLWFNQYLDIVKAGGGNFGRVINAIGSDSRISQSHTRVPGFDNKRGFGGACFPKDTSAFNTFAKTFSILDKVIEENNKYRSEYDKDERELEQNVKYG